jgi:transcriptional regulator of acetoin/glycerol metabolism
MKKFKNNSKLKFKDTLKSSQIYFDSNAGSTSLKVDGKKISIKQSDLEKVVYQTLKRISFDEDNYDRIKDFVISYTSLRRRRIIEEKQKLNIQINSI